MKKGNWIIIVCAALLVALAPTYDWTRSGFSFLLYGVALGVWGAVLALYLFERKERHDR